MGCFSHFFSYLLAKKIDLCYSIIRNKIKIEGVKMDLRDIKELLKDISKYIVIAVLVLLLVIYVVSLQQVVGPSMSPNYQDGDILILNKLHYKIHNPKRFEVVAIKYNDTKYFIKRVIGLPGETISYQNGILYVNGEVVEEKFKTTTTADFSLEDLGYETIPKDYYLVVGDNRENSLDGRSKEVGLIHKKEFIGKVSFRIWPFRRK